MSSNLLPRKKGFLERHGIIEVVYVKEPINMGILSLIKRIFSGLWTVEYVTPVNYR